MIQDNLLQTGGAGNAQYASAQPLTMFEQTQLGLNNFGNNNYAAAMSPDGVAQPTWSQSFASNASNSTAHSNPWQQMLAAFQSLLAQFQGNNPTAAQNASGDTAAPTAIKDGDFSSWGDPHLTLTGSGYDASGNPVTLNSKYDSMVGHSDLLNSGDIPGGFQVSTAVTSGSASGVTQNGSATFQGNFGNDSVTMNADGSSSIMTDGQAVNLANGSSVVLDGGETVTKNNDGSLTVAASTVDGSGTLSTTFKANGGGGVDVTGHAHNVSVGGDLVSGANTANPPVASQPMQGHHHHHYHHDLDNDAAQLATTTAAATTPAVANTPAAPIAPQVADTPQAPPGYSAPITPWSSVWQNGNQFSAGINGVVATANAVGSQSSGVGTFLEAGTNLSGAYEVQDPSSPSGDIFLRGNGKGAFGWGTTQDIADQVAAQNGSVSTQWYDRMNA